MLKVNKRTSMILEDSTLFTENASRDIAQLPDQVGGHPQFNEPESYDNAEPTADLEFEERRRNIQTASGPRSKIGKHKKTLPPQLLEQIQKTKTLF